MAKLTAKEKKWLIDFQKLLNACPSKRLGFYTIGDPSIMVYDTQKDEEISKLLDTGKYEFCGASNKLDADFCGLFFPSAVHSTAG